MSATSGLAVKRKRDARERRRQSRPGIKEEREDSRVRTKADERNREYERKKREDRTALGQRKALEEYKAMEATIEKLYEEAKKKGGRKKK